MKRYPPAYGKLSKAEIQPLAIEAKRAYDMQKEHGLLEAGESFDTWRRRQVLEATGGKAAGLSKASHGQFRAILATFLALQGRDIASYKTSMRTGQAPAPRATPAETIEDREQARNLLDHVMMATGYRQPYVMAVSKGKFGTGNYAALNAAQLMELVYTLRNRANARDGKGKAANRNKSQKAKTLAKTQDDKTQDTSTRAMPRPAAAKRPHNAKFLHPWVSLPPPSPLVS
jgi:hypothetical protein